MTPKQGLAFVKRHGIVLQAARGPVPSLAEAIAGGPIRGSWWGHAKGHEIFRVAEAVSEHPDVLVSKLIGGKITYVHRRLWPALVKLSSRFPKAGLAKTWNEHTATGAHRSRSVPFPRWVPSEVRQQAANLSIAEAERLLAPLLGAEKQAKAGGRFTSIEVHEAVFSRPPKPRMLAELKAGLTNYVRRRQSRTGSRG